jgi:hypothetical protein
MFKHNLSVDANDTFSLSVREKEILECLVEGMSYKMMPIIVSSARKQ